MNIKEFLAQHCTEPTKVQTLYHLARASGDVWGSRGAFVVACIEAGYRLVTLGRIQALAPPRQIDDKVVPKCR
jgi:hypothetical protein